MKSASHVRALFVVLVATASCARVVGIEHLDVDPLLPDASSETSVADEDVKTPIDSGAPDTTLTDVATEDGPPPPKRVFVTSDTSNGVLKDLITADNRCEMAAARAKLGGKKWIAWLSDSNTNAIDRLMFDGPYVRMDGKEVAFNKAQLASGALTHPITLMETSDPATNVLLVWTGTLSTGLKSVTCNDWTTANVVVFGAIGTLDNPKNGIWTDNLGPGGGFRNWGCQTTARLYCFEQ